MRPELLRARGVSKRFGALAAVERVDYSLREHEVAGLIGSNGAGKTTFFNLLTGYFRPDEGEILYRGSEITRLAPRARVALGIARTFQLTSTFDNLSVTDNLVLAFVRAHARSSLGALVLRSCGRYRGEARVQAALETFDLARSRERLVMHLSLGEKRRLEIAMALIGEPELVLLDEPLAGLSESEARAVLEVLAKRLGRQTVLIVEHKLSHVRDYVQRFTVMHEGRIIADGDYDECMRHPEVRRSYWQIGAGEAARC